MNYHPIIYEHARASVYFILGAKMHEGFCLCFVFTDRMWNLRLNEQKNSTTSSHDQ